MQAFFGGAILVSLGILAEYLAFITDEVNGKPAYIIRKFD